MDISIYIDGAITWYNKFFWSIVSLAVCFLVVTGVIFYSKMKNDKEKKWYSFEYVIKKKLTEMFVLIVMILGLLTSLDEIFSINTLSLFNASKYWKIVFSIWVIINIFQGKRLFNWLDFKDFIRRMKNGEYGYSTFENVMLDIIERNNSNYELQIEKLGILKSLTPISLIPLIAGYILEGKKIAVDWNRYTIAFFAILLVYFYSLWKCYKNLQLLKLETLEIQAELRNIQHKSER